jgi:hypothetical protein
LLLAHLHEEAIHQVTGSFVAHGVDPVDDADRLVLAESSFSIPPLPRKMMVQCRTLFP